VLIYNKEHQLNILMVAMIVAMYHFLHYYDPLFLIIVVNVFYNDLDDDVVVVYETDNISTTG
jgi:hypothetical protein